QAAKAVDVHLALRVLAAPTPGAAKRLARAIPLRPDWEAEKLGVMRAALRLKFPVYRTTLTDALLATGDALLVEGNTWGDQFRGVVAGAGQNWLGHLLMARRAEVRSGVFA
ncbi:MAG: NADAR family protein, partial [Phycicoccus sp.]